VIRGKKSLQVQVWHLKSQIPVDPGAGNLQVHPCSALILAFRRYVAFSAHGRFEACIFNLGEFPSVSCHLRLNSNLL
jgi:hypothetical protein